MTSTNVSRVDVDVTRVEALSMRRLGKVLDRDPMRLGLHRVPAREFPRLRGLAGELARYGGERELDKGLDVILAGLRPRSARRIDDA